MKHAPKSILTNSIALTLSPLVGLVFDHFVTKHFSTSLTWLRVLLTLLVTFTTAVVTYTIIYKITGYVPMGPANDD